MPVECWTAGGTPGRQGGRMRLGIDPKVDLAFKKLFGNEDNVLLLIHLLHSVIQPERPVTGLALVPAQSQKDTPRDKQAIADSRARDQGNRQFHVEMQGAVPWCFLNRLLFYWAKFHPQQLREGEDYQVLRPTITVCFVNQVVHADVAAFHQVFRLRADNSQRVMCDDLEIYLIELPKFTKTPEQLSSALDRWCYFLRHGADLDLEKLPAGLDVPEIRRAMEVLTVWTQDEIERAAYESRMKALRDESSLLREVREAKEARDEAVRALREATEAKEATAREAERAAREAERAAREAEVALEKGALIGQIRFCQELLKQPQASESELKGLSPGDLAALLAQLRRQALSGAG
jgi:predicted transposase/invertase (TIGR01784 family)